MSSSLARPKGVTGRARASWALLRRFEDRIDSTQASVYREDHRMAFNGKHAARKRVSDRNAGDERPGSRIDVHHCAVAIGDDQVIADQGRRTAGPSLTERSRKQRLGRPARI